MQRFLSLCFTLSAAPLIFHYSASAQESFSVVQTVRSNQLHLFAPVSVNGSAIKWWLVDTGAPVSLVAPEIARSLALPPARQGENVTVTNVGKKYPVVSAQSVKCMDMELGPAYLVAEPIQFATEKTRQARIAFEKEGLLGVNLLVKHGAVINCRTQQIFFSRNGRQLPLTREGYEKMGFTYIPIRITPRGYVEAEGTVGESTYSFVIDTGSVLTLLEPAIRDRARLAYYDTRRQIRMPYARARGTNLTVAEVPGFRLGAHDMSDLQLGFAETRAGDFGVAHEYGGLIGAELLFKRHAIIDLGNRALYLMADNKR